FQLRAAARTEGVPSWTRSSDATCLSEPRRSPEPQHLLLHSRCPIGATDRHSRRRDGDCSCPLCGPVPPPCWDWREKSTGRPQWLRRDRAWLRSLEPCSHVYLVYLS